MTPKDFLNRKERKGRRGIAVSLRPLRPLRLVKAPFRGLGVVMAFLLASCSPAVNGRLAATASSERETTRTVRDSVVLVIRDSASTRAGRDTVWVERWRTVTRDRLVERRDTLVVRDTLRTEAVRTLTREVPVRGPLWWAGLAAVAALAVWLVGKARGIFGTRRR